MCQSDCNNRTVLKYAHWPREPHHPLYAALAEKERALISQRTKAALAAAKARGVRLDNPSIAKAQAAGVDRVKTEADRFAANVMPVIGY